MVFVLEAMTYRKIQITKVYSLIVLGFAIILITLPSQVFIFFGCNASCLTQLYIWMISLASVGFGLIITLTQKRTNERLSGLYTGIFVIQLFTLIIWAYSAVLIQLAPPML